LEVLLRAHVDDEPARYTQTKDDRPDYAFFLPTDLPTDETVKLVLSRCYRGVNQWSRFESPRAHEGYWWRNVKQTSILIAYDLPAEIARLGYCDRVSNDDGFVFVLARHPDGNPNAHHPRLEIRPYGDGYSFRWRYPEYNTFRTKHHAGRFLNLSQLALALRDDEITFEEALTEWNATDLPELTSNMLAEFDALDLPISESKVYGPASLAKASLQKAGVRIPRIDASRLGEAMSAFHGPRVETRIRKEVKPVVYLDFRSMYPTVQALLGNWKLLTARSVRVESYTRKARELVRDLERDDLFNPELWPALNGFALVQPDDDLLPVRMTGESSLVSLRGSQALWWAIPDLIASKLLAGKVPTILKAWRLVPTGGSDDDYFVSLVNRRRDQPHLSKFLKVLANAGSYGVFAEVNEIRARPATLYGVNGAFYTESSEVGGRYYFPPIAAVITAGARLMLALLQSHVGEFVFCDTDSMAIVADESKWNEVEDIRQRFQALNPYRDGELLKLEDENYVDGERQQLYAYAIASKAYALFNIDGDRVTIRKKTDHGLGYLKAPKDGWIDELWLYLIQRDGLGTMPFGEGMPKWVDEPAINRVKIRTPHSWKQLGGEPFGYFEEPLRGPMGPARMAQKTISPYFADRRDPNTDSVDITSIRYCGKETQQLDGTRLIRKRTLLEERRCPECGEPIGHEQRADAIFHPKCREQLNNRNKYLRRKERLAA
jgi:hypothetical protein